MDRRSDARVGPAAAQIARHRGVDILVCGLRVAGQKVGGLHDLSGLAVTALRHLMVDPSGLNGVQRVGRAEPFDRYDLTPHIAKRQLAGAHCLTVDMDGAGATLRNATAVFYAGDVQPVPQRPEQWNIIRQIHRMTGAVDCQVHGCLLSADG